MTDTQGQAILDRVAAELKISRPRLERALTPERVDALREAQNREQRKTYRGR